MSGLRRERINDDTNVSSNDFQHHDAEKNIKSTANSTLASTRCHTPQLLPPIFIDGHRAILNNRSDKSGSSISQPFVERLWSRYHKNCGKRDSAYMDWSSSARVDKSSDLNKDKLGKSQSTLIPPNKASCAKDGEVLEIVDYLDRNRDFLESYVVNSVSLNDLERWIMMKMTQNVTNELETTSSLPTLMKNNNNSKQPQKQVFMDLVKSLQENTDEHSVLWKLVRSISSSIGVDAFRVYKIFPDNTNFVQYFVTDNSSDLVNPSRFVRANAQQSALVLETAKKGIPWRISRDDHPVSFPETPYDLLKVFEIECQKEANFVMYQPILTAAGKTSYVIEMWRADKCFSGKDEETCNNFLVWGSLALHYCTAYHDKKRERSMSDFLLDVVKAIFEEMVSLELLIKRILEFAQRLVNADRASLFLVDYRNFELVSTVFDLKFEPGLDRDMEKKEIRIPINRGIAGHVALSGETMNVPDAYSDFRFNREVDEVTGYKTVSILCMPIKVQGKVIGVVQMVNKRNHSNFDHEDEVAFEIFSTFFGLALHHAQLYDRIMRKEQKYRVALEVLSYHITCKESEVEAILEDKTELSTNINDFYLDPYIFNEFQKCKAVITMFDDLFDLSKFDVMTVSRFVLTVKKNYRRVPYHNFDHGWSVAHAMYVMLKNDHKEKFDYKMRLAMFVACLCHDLDHRGYTNKYMSETASPLAAMYTTSTLEHHHFNITVTILQQDGHNIFSNFSCAEYKGILGLIRQCILATDLAAFFPNLHKLQEIHGGDPHFSFNWSAPAHKELVTALSMTAADLSASAKPWDIQIKTVKVIFEEFYDQGDKEKLAGKTPIPMMDRNKPEEQPSSQVGFLSQICIPCYRMLYKILPSTKPMYVMALKNLNKWKTKADRILKELEKEMDDEIDQLYPRDYGSKCENQENNDGKNINEEILDVNSTNAEKSIDVDEREELFYNKNEVLGSDKRNGTNEDRKDLRNNSISCCTEEPEDNNMDKIK